MPNYQRTKDLSRTVFNIVSDFLLNPFQVLHRLIFMILYIVYIFRMSNKINFCTNHMSDCLPVCYVYMSLFSSSKNETLVHASVEKRREFLSVNKECIILNL